MRGLLVAPAAAAVLALTGCTAEPPAPAPPPKTSTGLEMLVSRASHTATLLPDGRALVAGGCAADGCEDNDRAQRSELFDPTRARFVEGPPMTVPRAGHTATALDDGRVLLTGGWPNEGRAPHASAEIFDQRTGAFAAVGSMTVARGAHTATRLPDGRVLIVGGVDGRRALTTVELFDPATDQFVPAADLPAPRATHGATLLAGGRVLVAGGQSGTGHGNSLVDTAVAFDPVAGRWTTVGRLSVP